MRPVTLTVRLSLLLFLAVSCQAMVAKSEGWPQWGVQDGRNDFVFEDGDPGSDGETLYLPTMRLPRPLGAWLLAILLSLSISESRGLVEVTEVHGHWASCQGIVCNEVVRQAQGLTRLKLLRNYVVQTMQLMDSLVTSLDHELVKTGQGLSSFIGPKCPGAHTLLQRVTTANVSVDRIDNAGIMEDLDESESQLVTTVSSGEVHSTSHQGWVAPEQTSGSYVPPGTIRADEEEEYVSPSMPGGREIESHKGWGDGTPSSGGFGGGGTGARVDFGAGDDFRDEDESGEYGGGHDEDRGSISSHGFGGGASGSASGFGGESGGTGGGQGKGRGPGSDGSSDGYGSRGSYAGGSASDFSGEDYGGGYGGKQHGSGGRWGGGGSGSRGSPGGRGSGGSTGGRGSGGGRGWGHRGHGSGGGKAVSGYTDSGHGAGCRGVPGNRVPGIDKWCSDNCAMGYCPETHCTCS